MKEKRGIAALAALAVLFVFMAYSNHFHNAFHFDDGHTIETNLNIRDIGNIPSFFLDGSKFSSLPANQAYRPLLTTLNAIEYRIGGGSTLPFHIVSFGMYLILCGLVAFVFFRLFEAIEPSSWNPAIALAGAAFYSVHTVHVETVSYISARSDLLSTLLVVAALAIYMAWPRGRRLQLHLIPIALGMLTKPTIAVTPLLLLFYSWLIEEGVSLGGIFSRQNRSAVIRGLLRSLPAWAVCTSFLALSSRMTPPTFTPSSVSRLDYALTQPWALLHYFLSFFLPFGLSADIELELMNRYFDDRVIIGVLLIVTLLACAAAASRRTSTRPIAYGLLWFFITSIPTSCGIVPLSESMNDHRMFFPFVGLMLSAVWSVRLLARKFLPALQSRSALRWGLSLLLACLYLAHGWGTHQRCAVWKDAESLWWDVTQKRPANGRGHMNYGVAKMAKGDYRTARACFEKTLSLSPNYHLALINLAIAKNALGETQGVDELYRRALALNPKDPGSYLFYARHLMQKGKPLEARTFLQQAVALSPARLDARQLLMEVLARKGLWRELEACALETLRLAPNDPKAQAYREVCTEQNPGVRQARAE
ncbi:MAG: tetratricopeptide repeat protein, partial [Acidobacteriota bacterium]